jgi:type 1 fimbria pilin
MKELLLFISLFFTSLSALAACSYNGGYSTVAIGFDGAKILSDPSLPVGSILAVRTVGVGSIKEFYNCGTADLYAVKGDNNLVAGVTGVLGGPVYETGINGVGFQISDAITGSAKRPVPATLGSVSAYGLTNSNSNVSQITVWLIKTGNIDTDVVNTPDFSILYLAGNVNQVNTGADGARLLRINVKSSTLTYRETSCNITPRGGGTVNLPDIDVSDLIATAQGAATGKQKQFTLDITCPATSVGNKFFYWFNPISETSSKNGVLLNSISGGAENVGIIIKKDSTPVKFSDYTGYSIASVASYQSIDLTADYYKLSNSVTAGSVQAIFEVVLQEE